MNRSEFTLLLVANEISDTTPFSNCAKITTKLLDNYRAIGNANLASNHPKK